MASSGRTRRAIRGTEQPWEVERCGAHLLADKTTASKDLSRIFNPSQPQAGSEGREPRGHRKVSMKAAISCKTISEASR
jgi:hypothetical protein